ncbi:MAG: alpha-glucosidase C-terminal domain-containing protein [Anaerolineales bacterium]|nr:alpha-glucosidase C-terminal domain-containing protein [Anaerolineales bacterium]
MTVPSWVSDAVFYQIFPDRFANGDPDNDPPNTEPWGSPPTIWNFQGGDLRGIIQNLDYLVDLGINAIYLNPIFTSPSNHRYNTSNYYEIDPKLGSMQDFLALLNTAHQNQIKIILDGVFNHCGRGFFAFADTLENGERSPYKDWFHIHKFPLDAYGPGNAENYLGWWGFKSLPKFNTSNPQVRNYILDIARYWIDQGIDGWRLDVPGEIDDDDFWAEFRQVVKSANREAYLVGEIWTADPRWANDSHFDGLMNYPLKNALVDCFKGKNTVSQLAGRINSLLTLYPHENTLGMYNPLGSHDTERIYTLLDQSLEKVKLAFLFLFAYPGAPAIYYGDEIGLEGHKDPECRKAFHWDSTQWKGDLRPWIQTLIENRKTNPSLRYGEFKQLLAEDHKKVFAFSRTYEGQSLLVLLNFSETAQEILVPVSGLGWDSDHEVRSILDNKLLFMDNHHIVVNLPPLGGAWIR